MFWDWHPTVCSNYIDAINGKKRGEDETCTYPTKIAFSAAKKSMKYKVASTENAMEYGFRGLLFSVAEDE